MEYLRVAVCDDDKAQVSVIERLLEQIATAKLIELEILVFYDGETLKKYYMQGNTCDIVYLDIEMKEMNGIDAAKFIRSIDLEVIIIYVSGYENYMLKLFEVEPFRFIKKPIDSKYFEKTFYKAYQKIVNNPVYYEYRYNKMFRKVLIKDILYFESQGRVVFINLVNGEQNKFYGKLDLVEKTLYKCKVPFLRIHQSYLINSNFAHRF